MVSGNDPLVPHDLAMKHLGELEGKSHVRVISKAEHAHGGFLTDGGAQDELFKAMDECLWGEGRRAEVAC